jgi:hypothetical protein
VQVRGIAQGSILSPALCNLYLGNVEGGKEGEEGLPSLLDLQAGCDCSCWLKDEEAEGGGNEGEREGGREGKRTPALVLRMIDDYLFVSPSRDLARKFVERIHAILPSVGREGDGGGGREGGREGGKE